MNGLIAGVPNSKPHTPVRGNYWVGYDDVESVAIKLDYILANDLGGVMYWSLETDDFS